MLEALCDTAAATASRLVAEAEAAEVFARQRAEAQAQDEEGDSVLCVVCMDAPSTHAFVPCGHRSVCAACSVTVFGMFNQLCPVRRFPSPLHQIIFCVGERCF